MMRLHLKPSLLRIRTYTGSSAVNCYRRFKHLAVTKSVNEGLLDRYNVTHIVSGSIAFGPFKREKNAELIAAAFDVLPVWKHAAISRAKGTSPAFKRAWASLSPEIHRWRLAVHEACKKGEL